MRSADMRSTEFFSLLCERLIVINIHDRDYSCLWDVKGAIRRLIVLSIYKNVLPKYEEFYSKNANTILKLESFVKMANLSKRAIWTNFF